MPFPGFFQRKDQDHEKDFDLDNMSDEEFSNLCKDFLNYYDDYMKAIGKVPNLNDKGQVNWVLFGVSGAGKSTTVARLLDKTSSAQHFWKRLQLEKQSKNHSVFAEVRIGHEANSCTVVPAPSTIKKGLHVTDMPGFAETNGRKKISIDILQKCYMTHVTKFRLLIVVEMSCLYQTKLQTLRDHYHTALWKLLGPDYERGINHFYFLLTKKNEVDPEAKDYEAVLSKAARQLISKNGDKDTVAFSRFLYRLLDHHKVVDLETCTSATLLNDIQEMIDTGEQDAGSLRPFEVDELTAGENKLNELCVRYLAETVLKKQTSFGSAIKEVEDGWTLTSTSLDRVADEMQVKKREAVEEEAHCEEQLRRVMADIDNYEPALAQFETEKIAASKRLVVSEQKLNIFRTHSTTSDFVNVRVDVSSRRGIGRLCIAEINADMSSDGSTEDIIIVTEYEKDDATLKSRIGRGGTLIPSTIAAIKQLKDGKIVYNSSTGFRIRDCEIERPPTSSDGLRSIKVKMNRPFKIYMFSTRPFSSMPFFKDLENEFAKEVESDRAYIAQMSRSISDRKEKHTTDLALKTEFTENLEKARFKVKTMKGEIEHQLEASHSAIDSMKAEVATLTDEINLWQNRDQFMQVKRIIKIFYENKIHTRARSLEEEFESKHRSHVQKLSALSDIMVSFEESNIQRLNRLLDDFEKETESGDPFFDS